MRSDKEQAACILARIHAIQAKRRHRYKVLKSALSMLCIGAALAAGCISWYQTGQLTKQPDGRSYTAENTTPLDYAPAGDTAQDLSREVYFNQLDVASADAARRYYDPETTYEEKWDAAQFLSYFGKEVRPGWLPEGMTLQTQSNTVIRETDDTLCYDTWTLTYRQKDYEAGTYQPTEPLLRLSVSKIGLLSDCIYVFDQEKTPSVIWDTTVWLGTRQMSYGPYDPDTHEPSGYYELCIAEFSCADVQYELVGENITRDDFVRIVASMLK